MRETDDRWYGRFLSGDKESYGELMRAHGDELVLYLHALVHSWEDAEDLMVEAFARIMVKRPTIRPGGFKAYLYKTARNLAARFHGRARRAELFSLDELEDALPAGELPEALAQETERRRALFRCLERIEPALREALWLVYCEDLPYKEAAAVMKVSEKRIDHLLQRGKRLLREELAKEGVTDAAL